MILQLIISGLAIGSVYALLALAMVLIHKATDVVNFAQGEMAMFPPSFALRCSIALVFPSFWSSS